MADGGGAEAIWAVVLLSAASREESGRRWLLEEERQESAALAASLGDAPPAAARLRGALEGERLARGELTGEEFAERRRLLAGLWGGMVIMLSGPLRHAEAAEFAACASPESRQPSQQWEQATASSSPARSVLRATPPRQASPAPPTLRRPFSPIPSPTPGCARAWQSPAAECSGSWAPRPPQTAPPPPPPCTAPAPAPACAAPGGPWAAWALDEEEQCVFLRLLATERRRVATDESAVRLGMVAALRREAALARARRPPAWTVREYLDLGAETS
eukprot:TRINITY_DN34129_c0_g1_i2.p2 TRINITY_DN34129_c0_g1~~TRINITY_DN34129_c0_g1_i2.p2  ORF type:complete len:275 (+),score=43.48 TRINITY_DN34129_c0_g1_i2:100-924(+)